MLLLDLDEPTDRPHVEGPCARGGGVPGLAERCASSDSGGGGGSDAGGGAAAAAATAAAAAASGRPELTIQYSDKEDRTLFFAKVNPSAPPEEVAALFSRFGAVESVNLFRAWATARTSKGCGLVVMATQAAAAAAHAALSGKHVWRGAETTMAVEWCNARRLGAKAAGAAATKAAAAGQRAAAAAADARAKLQRGGEGAEASTSASGGERRRRAAGSGDRRTRAAAARRQPCGRGLAA